MTCEVLKGAKVKGWFHGRVAISNSASELVDHHLPFPLPHKQLCLCGSTSCSRMEKQTRERYMNTECDYKWFLPHQCTIRVPQEPLEKKSNKSLFQLKKILFILGLAWFVQLLGENISITAEEGKNRDGLTNNTN